MNNKSTYLPAFTIGENAYADFAKICKPLGKRLLIVGGKTALSVSQALLLDAIKDDFDVVDTVIYGNECTDARVKELNNIYINKSVDFIVGVGGGKAIDTAKCLADLMNKQVVTIPTIASNCAPSSALSVVYTADHCFAYIKHFDRPAYHCFINTKIISEAPHKYIRAGVGDTLAKYYEVEFSARGRNLTYEQQFGVAVSNICRKPLMSNAKEAIEACKMHNINSALEKTAQIIIVSTGIVSASVGEDLNGALAHAWFYGLTNIKGFEEKFLHGDVVGYAILVQLALDKKYDELNNVREFLIELDIETSLAKRDVLLDREAFDKVLDSTLADPDMKVVPYEITKDMVFEAAKYVESLK